MAMVNRKAYKKRKHTIKLDLWLLTAILLWWAMIVEYADY